MCGYNSMQQNGMAIQIQEQPEPTHQPELVAILCHTSLKCWSWIQEYPQSEPVPSGECSSKKRLYTQFLDLETTSWKFSFEGHCGESLKARRRKQALPLSLTAVTKFTLLCFSFDSVNHWSSDSCQIVSNHKAASEMCTYLVRKWQGND